MTETGTVPARCGGTEDRRADKQPGFPEQGVRAVDIDAAFQCLRAGDKYPRATFSDSWLDARVDARTSRRGGSRWGLAQLGDGPLARCTITRGRLSQSCH